MVGAGAYFVLKFQPQNDVNRRLVSSVGRAPDCRAGGQGF